MAHFEAAIERPQRTDHAMEVCDRIRALAWGMWLLGWIYLIYEFIVQLIVMQPISMRYNASNPWNLRLRLVYRQHETSVELVYLHAMAIAQSPTVRAYPA